MAAPFQPANYRAVNPYLLVSDGDRLLRFLHEVFDARDLDISRNPQGRLQHASVAIGDRGCGVRDVEGNIWWIGTHLGPPNSSKA